MDTKAAEVGPLPDEIPLILPVDSPTIYFDIVTAQGSVNGVVQVTLEMIVSSSSPKDGKAQHFRKVAANLRCSHKAALSLSRALEKAHLAGTPRENPQ